MEPVLAPPEAIPKHSRTPDSRVQYSPSLTGPPEGGAVAGNTEENFRSDLRESGPGPARPRGFPRNRNLGYGPPNLEQALRARLPKPPIREQERPGMRRIFVSALRFCLAAPTLCQAAGVATRLEKMTQDGGRMRAEFSVTNSGVAVSTVVVKCTMFDKDQRPLGTATGRILNLSAGERDIGVATTAHAIGMEEVRCRVEGAY